MGNLWIGFLGVCLISILKAIYSLGVCCVFAIGIGISKTTCPLLRCVYMIGFQFEGIQGQIHSLEPYSE